MFLRACNSTALAALTALGFSITSLHAEPEDMSLPPEVANRAPAGCTQQTLLPPPGKSLWMTNLWTGGVVPYVFDANTTPAHQAAMRTAMDTLEAVANIHFVPRSAQTNYLIIRDSTGNNSFVGMIGGSQTVNIFNWNFNFIMCHELMHALGVKHEQSRPDRDQYVTINYANIDTDEGQCGGSCAHNFDIASGSVHGPYDFDSIMHYGQDAFSRNGLNTITVLPPNQAWQTQIGQRTHLSTGDIAGLVSRYGAVPSSPWNQRLASGPSARDGCAMAYDSFRGVTVLFGGMTNSGRSAETWEWNGATWTQRTVTGPSARYLHAMAYDSTRRVTVLFGGSTSSTYNNETWEWNGTAWTQRTVTGPSARNLHAMAYDADRGVTVLFGGATSASGRNAETWTWSGSSWTQRAVSGPTGRSGHAMAFDSRRGVTVLQGGQAAGSNYPGDTWEWSGTAWTQRSTSGPSGRYQHALAYDPARAVAALFAGWNGSTLNSEGWDWSGTAWLQRGASGPTARYGHAMAHDLTRSVTVMFGGNTGSGRSAETWELGTPCAAPTISSQPTAQTGCSGYTATFAVVAGGPGTISYQWRKGGNPIADVAGRRSGTITPTLTITGTNSSDVGSYDCVVTSTCGTSTSNTASLAVTTSPTPVSAMATPPSICAGAGQSAVLSATAVGNPPIRWYNAATNQPVTSPVSPTVTTSYYAVSNPFSCPSGHSQTVTVTVTQPPVAPTAIQVAPPEDGSYCTPPASITLQAVGGNGAIAWRKSDGTPASGCGATSITGGADGTLVVSPAPTVTTTYYARVTSGCGDSPCASLTINVGCTADLGSTGGVPVGDCILDNNDFVTFIDYFFNSDPRADRGGTGGQPGSDGTFDNNDFIVFIDQFFAGCN